MRRSVLAAGILAVAALAVPGHADELTVPGCAGVSGPTPGTTVTVGPLSVRVPSLTDVQVCAFDSVTVTYDVDPIEESSSCAYGPGVEVGGPGVAFGGGPAVRYTADGQPAGGTIVDLSPLGFRTEGIDTGPLWMIPCRGR